MMMMRKVRTGKQTTCISVLRVRKQNSQNSILPLVLKTYHFLHRYFFMGDTERNSIYTLKNPQIHSHYFVAYANKKRLIRETHRNPTRLQGPN